MRDGVLCIFGWYKLNKSVKVLYNNITLNLKHTQPLIVWYVGMMPPYYEFILKSWRLLRIPVQGFSISWPASQKCIKNLCSLIWFIRVNENNARSKPPKFIILDDLFCSTLWRNLEFSSLWLLSSLISFVSNFRSTFIEVCDIERELDASYSSWMCYRTDH